MAEAKVQEDQLAVEQLEPLSSYDVDQCRPVSASLIETGQVVVVLQGER